MKSIDLNEVLAQGKLTMGVIFSSLKWGMNDYGYRVPEYIMKFDRMFRGCNNANEAQYRRNITINRQ